MDLGAEFLKVIREHYGARTEKGVVGLALAAIIVGCLGVICGTLYAGGIAALHIADYAIEGGIDRKTTATIVIYAAAWGLLYGGFMWLVERFWLNPRRKKFIAKWEADSEVMKSEIQRRMDELEATAEDVKQSNDEVRELCVQAKEQYLETLETDKAVQRLIQSVVEYAEEHGITTDEALVRQLLLDIAKRRQP